MAFDFPTPTAVGQTFTPTGGPTYAWNGYAWVVRPPTVIPGTLVEISRQTVSSAVASVDFTSGIDATYDEYELHFYNVQTSANGNLGLRISQDGGATWKAGASDYNYQEALLYNPTSAGGLGAGSLSFVNLGEQGPVGAQNKAVGVVRFFTPTIAGIVKSFLIHTHCTATNFNSVIGSSAYQADNNAFNGLRVLGLAGNLTSGTFVLYGVSRTPASLSGGTTVTVSDTPPANPSQGNLWWESDSGKLWISYNDGNSQQWVAVAPSGVPPSGPVLLATRTANNSPTIDFISLMDATYDEYEVHFFDVAPATNLDTLMIRIGIGGVIQTGVGYVWATKSISASAEFISGSGGANASVISVGLPGNVPTNAGCGMSGVIRIPKPSGTTNYKNIQSSLSHGISGVNMISSTGMGYWAALNAIDSLRFVFNGGTIATGTFKLYGVR